MASTGVPENELGNFHDPDDVTDFFFDDDLDQPQHDQHGGEADDDDLLARAMESIEQGGNLDQAFGSSTRAPSSAPNTSTGVNHVEDDERDHTDDEGHGGGSQANVSQAPEATQEDETPTKTKKAGSKRMSLDVERLLNPENGVPYMLKTFSKHVRFSNKPGMETRNLRLLMDHYDAWMDQLMPKMSLSNVVDTIERLGHKAAVRTYLTDLRLSQAVRDEERGTDEQHNSHTQDSGGGTGDGHDAGLAGRDDGGTGDDNGDGELPRKRRKSRESRQRRRQRARRSTRYALRGAVDDDDEARDGDGGHDDVWAEHTEQETSAAVVAATSATSDDDNDGEEQREQREQRRVHSGHKVTTDGDGNTNTNTNTNSDDSADAAGVSSDDPSNTNDHDVDAADVSDADINATTVPQRTARHDDAADADDVHGPQQETQAGEESEAREEVVAGTTKQQHTEEADTTNTMMDTGGDEEGAKDNNNNNNTDGDGETNAENEPTADAGAVADANNSANDHHSAKKLPHEDGAAGNGGPATYRGEA
ncbi:hypothetical protein PTSG_01322 [Salpingoeca rosetta]|uniref:Chromosome segregation in meiosis protein 3 domain-containing protein n=1 Tax=Salpingoeca rosetta (strain ATCC 50818 / BSB-021) TaxID=946362 RepID=F2U004_SALR5|nr:uncharacterized protein PTSG_01322 [Salpingoeca rosetta]EGD80732.1 hypothetical protein PTSG_01322 [Salpingoeca rosetta]|eukprot:XP_004997293.1 hypothetical protein PTSG_01322 [Salpingoeca rosetta]